MSTTIWTLCNGEANIRSILASAPPSGHGPMIMSAYQIAIAFQDQFPADFASIGKPVGGLGSGQRDSASQYLAGQLRERIDRSEITDIEIVYIDPRNLSSLVFDNHGSQVVASGPASGFSTAFFRLRVN